MMFRYHEHLRHLLTDHEPSPHPDNANMGDVEEIMASVLANGCYAPVHVSAATDRIVKGHHLYLALRELGATTWPLAYLEDLDPLDELRLMTADNRTSRLAVLDTRAEVENLRRLAGTSLAGTGYADHHLERMTAALAREDSVPLDLGHQHGVPLEETCPVCGQRRK